jgi:hypothetical protein
MAVWQSYATLNPGGSSIYPSSLKPFQLQYRNTNETYLTVGNETTYGVLDIDGLDFSATRSGDSAWPRDHGEAVGLDVLGGRDIILELWVKPSQSPSLTLQEAQKKIAEAFVPSPNVEYPLYFALPNSSGGFPVLYSMCRVRHRVFKIESDYAAGNILKANISLHATDPRLYAVTQKTSLTLNTGVSVTNSGTFETRPVVKIAGEATAKTGSPQYRLLRVENTTAAASVNLGVESSGATGKVIATGETWTLDYGLPHKLENGSGTTKLYSAYVGREAGRTATDISKWWSLAPGANTVKLVGETVSSASIEWASAYLI